MFKKENVQFYVGAAVGVTVGLCVGKFLSPNTSDIRNKLHSNISDAANVGASVRPSTDDISNDDNVPIDTHKSHYCSSTSRYKDNNFEGSTFLMTPLTKSASCESKININNATPIKQMKLNNMPSNYGSYRITREEEDLNAQDAHFLKKSYGRNVKEEITIFNENIEQKNIIQGKFDNFDSVVSSSSDSNMATCNTLLDEERVNSTSTSNESLDVKQYDEFSKTNLLSSTTYDVSISF